MHYFSKEPGPDDLLKLIFWSIAEWSVSQYWVILYYLVHSAIAQEYQMVPLGSEKINAHP